MPFSPPGTPEIGCEPFAVFVALRQDMRAEYAPLPSQTILWRLQQHNRPNACRSFLVWCRVERIMRDIVHHLMVERVRGVKDMLAPCRRLRLLRWDAGLRR